MTETTMRFPDDDGGVAHAELRLGNAVIVVFSDRDGYQRPPRKGDTMGYGTYLRLAEATDVDAVHTRALAAGATGIWEPGTTEWGNYRCRVLDPEGFEWTVRHPPARGAPRRLERGLTMTIGQEPVAPPPPAAGSPARPGSHGG